jgi:multicomponent Na+:H+ antiporter subunit A
VRLYRASSLFPLTLIGVLAACVPGAAAGVRYGIEFAWIPSLAIRLSFTLDGLSLLFSMVICGVGFFIFLYAADYLHGHPQTGRLYLFLTAFTLSMLGLVLADNLILMFVFWELTTLLSYLLIGFEHEAPPARDSARQALLVTGAGGLSLLIGILMLGMCAGTYELSNLLAQGAALRQHSLYLPILATVFFGAFTKSAQVPFHFWLPNAMAAPTPISAFLHSATMVKAGIYLLARLHPLLGGTPAWMGTLVLVGAVTALTGSVLAMNQSDLKRVLAYTTIMALGILTMFLGGKTTPALTAAMTFLLVHSLYKSALFLVVGSVDHQAGSRRLEKLGGLLRAMPLTAFGAAAAALSMAGFPLFFGFIGKEIMYEGALTEEMFPFLATTTAVLSNALMTAVAGVVFILPFLGRKAPPSTPVSEAPPAMWIGPAVMGGLTIFFGIVPDWVGRWLIEPAVRAFHPATDTIRLELFHGINEPLLLSIVTLSLGTLIYFGRGRIRRLIDRGCDGLPLSGSRAYELALKGVAGLGRLQVGLLQNGSLQRYLVIVVTTFIAAVGVTLIRGAPAFPAIDWMLPEVREFLLILLILAAVATVIGARSRLLAICALGMIGAAIAMIFSLFGAPDVALTQLLVETLTVIIVSIVLLRLPTLHAQPPTGKMGRVFNAVLALTAGGLVTCLVLAITSGNHPDRFITSFFENNAYLLGHGRNIVNVILVDFRGMDTLGEIIVVATAGWAGYALIRKGDVK